MFWGRYGAVEAAATVIALVLAGSAVVAVASVFDNPGALGGGFVPAFPENVQHREVLPWIGCDRGGRFRTLEAGSRSSSHWTHGLSIDGVCN